MRRSTKKRLIPLALALVLAMVGAALATAAINVNVTRIGGGGNTNVAVDTTQANITWSVSEATITGATITLDQGPGVDSNWEFYVTLDDGTVIQKSGTIAAGDTSITVSGLNIDLTQNSVSSVRLVISQQ